MNLAGDYTLQEAYQVDTPNITKFCEKCIRCIHEQTFYGGQCTFVCICVRRPFLSQSPPQVVPLQLFNIPDC